MADESLLAEVKTAKDQLDELEAVYYDQTDMTGQYATYRTEADNAEEERSQALARRALEPPTEESLDQLRTPSDTEQSPRERASERINALPSQTPDPNRPPPSIHPEPPITEIYWRDAITRLTGDDDWAGNSADFTDDLIEIQKILEEEGVENADLLGPGVTVVDILGLLPAMVDPQTFKKMREQGVDVSRLNDAFSYAEMIPLAGAGLKAGKSPLKKALKVVGETPVGKWLGKIFKPKGRFTGPSTREEKLMGILESSMSESGELQVTPEARQKIDDLLTDISPTVTEEGKPKVYIGGEKGRPGVSLDTIATDEFPGARGAAQFLQNLSTKEKKIATNADTVRKGLKRNREIRERVDAGESFEAVWTEIGQQTDELDGLMFASKLQMATSSQRVFELFSAKPFGDMSKVEQMALLNSVTEHYMDFHAAREIPRHIAQGLAAGRIPNALEHVKTADDFATLMEQYGHNLELVQRALEHTGDVGAAMHLLETSLKRRRWNGFMELYYASILGRASTILISAASAPVFITANVGDRLFAAGAGKARRASHKARSGALKNMYSRKLGKKFEPRSNEHAAWYLEELGLPVPTDGKVTDKWIKGLLDQTEASIGVREFPKYESRGEMLKTPKWYLGLDIEDKLPKGRLGTEKRLKQLLVMRGHQYTPQVNLPGTGMKIGGLSIADDQLIDEMEHVEVGEAWALIAGAIEGTGDAWVAFTQAAKTGKPLRGQGAGTKFDRMLASGTHMSALDSSYLQVKGPVARIVDFLGFYSKAVHASMLMPDEAFKAITRSSEFRALVYRRVRKEMRDDPDTIKLGFNHPDIKAKWAKRTNDLLEPTGDFAEEVAPYVDKRALENALQDEMGALAKTIDAAADWEATPYQIKPLRFVQLFTRVTSNAFREGPMRRTPLGRFGKEYHEAIARGGVDADIARGRMAAGSAVASWFMWMAYNGQIIGQMPLDHRQRLASMQTGRRPNSVLFGGGGDPSNPDGVWVTIGRVEPYAWAATTAADIVMLEQYLNVAGSEHDVPKSLAEVLGQMFMMALANMTINKGYMSGTSDLMDGMMHPERYGSAVIERFAASWVPGPLKDMARYHDPYMREVSGAVDAVMKQLPFSSDGLPFIHDVWGERLMYDRDLFTGAVGASLPLNYSPVSPDQINHEIYRLGVEGTPVYDPRTGEATGKIVKHRDALVSKPGRYIKGVEMPLDLYGEYIEFVRRDLKASRFNGLADGEFIHEGMTIKEAMNSMVSEANSEYAGQPPEVQAGSIKFLNDKWNQAGQKLWILHLKASSDPRKAALYDEMVLREEQNKRAKGRLGEELPGILDLPAQTDTLAVP